MAIQDGFSRYACDVCGCAQKCYTTPGTDAAAGYVRKQYIDQNGQTREYVLCTSHAEQWNKLMSLHDSQISAFIKDGTLPSELTPTTSATASE